MSMRRSFAWVFSWIIVGLNLAAIENSFVNAACKNKCDQFSDWVFDTPSASYCEHNTTTCCYGYSTYGAMTNSPIPLGGTCQSTAMNVTYFTAQQGTVSCTDTYTWVPGTAAFVIDGPYTSTLYNCNNS